IQGTGQYSDPPVAFNTVYGESGLVGQDTLAGTVSGCHSNSVTVTNGVITSQSGGFAAIGCTGLSNSDYKIQYSGTIEVSPENASIAFAGPWMFSTGSATATSATVNLSANIAQENDGHPGNLALATADFLLFKSTNTGTTPDLKVLNAPVTAGGVVS